MIEARAAHRIPGRAEEVRPVVAERGPGRRVRRREVSERLPGAPPRDGWNGRAGQKRAPARDGAAGREPAGRR